MALTYRAPGVYVEEIPSARQPIAGVGTNTVGFIGLIRDDSVYIPVVNPDYDPVLAQHLFDFHHPPAAVPQALQTDLRPGEADAAQRAATQALQTELNRVTTELGTVQANVDDLTNNRVPQAQDAVHRAETQLRDATDANRADLERDVRNQQTQLTRAQRELRTATQRRDELQQLRDELSNQLPASGGGTGQQPGSGTGQQPGGGTGQQPGGGTGQQPGGGTRTPRVTSRSSRWSILPSSYRIPIPRGKFRRNIAAAPMSPRAAMSPASMRAPTKSAASTRRRPTPRCAAQSR